MFGLLSPICFEMRGRKESIWRDGIWDRAGNTGRRGDFNILCEKNLFSITINKIK